MKSLSAKLGLFFLVTGLAIWNTNVWGTDWKEFAQATTGVFYYDAGSMASPSQGILRVWIHNATKHETSLSELNCKDDSYRVLDVVEYDKEGNIKNRNTYYDNTTWLKAPPGSVLELLDILVCP